MKNHSLFVLERKHWTIFLCVLVGVGWLTLAIYSLSGSRQTNGMLTPEEIAKKSVKTPKQSSTPATMIPERKGISAKVVADKGMTMPTFSPILPLVEMTSTSMHVRQTSNAIAKVVGSGAGNDAGASISSSNHSKGINYNGLGFGGNMLAMSSSLILSAPGDGYANDIASTTISERNGVHRAKKVNDDPLDPFLDPIGDVTWGWLILLAVGYMLFRYRRRTRA